MGNQKRNYFFKIGLGVSTFLLCALAVHIYLVTRPGKIDEHTIALTRIDFKQDIREDDVGKISNWLSDQEGVLHVMCNAGADNVVLSYKPLLANSDKIVQELCAQLHYQAERHVPDAAALSSGCPMKAPSVFSRLRTIF